MGAQGRWVPGRVVPPSTNTIVQPECDDMRRHVEALAEADGDDVEAIIQFGANLAFDRQAADAERWLEKPVIAVNTATYWHALRTAGIADAVHGYGSLLERH